MMRRSVEEESESERSSDEESTNFKRRRTSKKARSDEDQVDRAPVTNSIRLNDLPPQRATRSSSRLIASNPNSDSSSFPNFAVTFKNPPLPQVSSTTEHAINNGVKSIPCPVITRKLPEEVVKVERLPKPVEPEAVRVVPSVSSNSKSTIISLTNGSKAVKKPAQLSFRSSATEIMKQMGFDCSRGLGRTMNDLEIATSTLQEMNKLLKEAEITVDNSAVDFEEEICLDEKLHWIAPVFPFHQMDYAYLSQWRKVGPQLTTVREATTFVDPDALKNVLALKRCLSVLNEYEYAQVRARSNPFETLGKGPFLCRAALKMANLDFALSNAVTQPTSNSADKQSTVGPNDLFYFADVCAGPGGFTEYILQRKKWEAKGFGMTLKGKLDFDLWSSTVANADSFEPFYGPAGDGDVYNPANTSAFINYIKSATEGHRVHLMMADGGFDIDNKEQQEILSAQIYLSQCYLALSLVRPGGMFICKLFDALTPFTVGLIYLMYLSFDLVALHKPSTSRPANSERYLICKWKKQDSETEGITAYLAACYAARWELKQQHDQNPEENNNEILELVPIEVLTGVKEFYKYLVESNTRIARKQVESLKKMVILSRDPNLRDPRQQKIKEKLFDIWKIPEPTTSENSQRSADTAFKEILLGFSSEFLQCPEYPLTEHNVEAFIRSPFDWRIVVVGGTQQEFNRGFYLSLGRDRIYSYRNKTWMRIEDRLELCKDTLVYGEFVEEIQGKKPTQRTFRTFHIIDAMVLGGMDVRARHYTARLEVCIKFAKSMNKPSNPDLCRVRAKIPVRMENIADVFDRLENRVIQGRGSSAHLLCPVDHTDETLPFIEPSGILFLKITKDPWTMALSKSSNRKYYFNLTTGKSSYDLVLESVSEFDYSMQHRMVWWWDRELRTVMSTQDVLDTGRAVTTTPGVLNPQRLLQYIDSAMQANRTSVMRRLSSSSSGQGSS